LIYGLIKLSTKRGFVGKSARSLIEVLWASKSQVEIGV
jgi:hypothetical protein